VGRRDDSTVKTEDILRAFQNETRTKLKESARKIYISTFKAFAKEVDLWKFSKRQLQGKKGKDLILSFISNKPLPSWRCNLAFLKLVWTYGLGLN
jgi:hypothetical protein